jgi:hypothetical protein
LRPGRQRARRQTGLPLLRAARPLAGKVSRAIGPLTRSGGSVALAVRQLPTLTRTVGVLTAVALPLFADVRRADLARAIDDTEALIAQVRADDLVALAARAGREAPPLLRRVLRVQLETLAVQRESLRAQLASLDVQRESLTHIRSIDRKTGGTLPAGAPAPAAP